jgi:tetratricopeptide (TPR) repeat protein
MEKLFIKMETSHLLNKKAVLPFFIFLFSHLAGAQNFSRQDEKLWLKADKTFEFGDYMGALKMYGKLHIIDSSNKEINYKIGICNFEIKTLRSKALKYFIQLRPADFPEVNYYLGRLYHLLGNYESAIDCYKQYGKYKGVKEHTLKEINDLIEKSHTAQVFILQPDEKVQIQNLGNKINTMYPEYVPLIPADEDFMIFTSRRKNDVYPNTNELGEYYEDIYMSKRRAGVWQSPEMMDTTINTAGHDACTGLSADGEKLLIYRTSLDLKSGDIYESLYLDKKWTKAAKLGPNVNSNDYLEASACYSPEGEVVFFSSNRPGGFGGKDIYSVKKLPNGEWGLPFNLGPKINTEYNEDAPYMHPSGNLLFFSSEGHKNMGGYDIFKSSFDEYGNFNTPVNLGYPINKVDDDIFFVLNTNASTGYLSSEREGGYGSQDIYKVNFLDSVLPYKVHNLYVYDALKNVVKKSEVLLTDSASGKIYGVFKSNENTGKILIVSEPYKEYMLTITAPGYKKLVLLSEFNKASDSPYVLQLKKEEDISEVK